MDEQGIDWCFGWPEGGYCFIMHLSFIPFFINRTIKSCFFTKFIKPKSLAQCSKPWSSFEVHQWEPTWADNFICPEGGSKVKSTT
jgi:hypothetical protein